MFADLLGPARPLARCAALGVAALGLATPLAAQARVGSISGRVVDAGTRAPIAEARVELDEGGATVTRADGRFVLRPVAPGARRLRASAIGYRPAQAFDVVVSEGRATPVDFALETAPVQLESITVTPAPFAAPPDIVSSRVSLSYEEIRRSPGALGDVTRLVQALPGVGNGGNDQRNDLIARGGSPIENLILVDNVEVPNLSHFAATGNSGGPISMLNNELLSDATFLAGAMPAAYGSRLSSVLDVRLREGSRERAQVELDINAAGAGLVGEAPLGRRGSVIASVRQSYLDLLAGPFGLDAVPVFTNWQGKATWDLSPTQSLWLVHLGGVDRIGFEGDATDLGEPEFRNVDNRGWRAITGLNWQHALGRLGVGTLGVSDASGGYRNAIEDLDLGGAPIYRERSGDGQTTLKYDLAFTSRGPLALKAGALAQRLRGDFRLEQPLGLQDPFRTDPGRVDAVDIDRTLVAWVLAGYGQATLDLGRAATLTLGARAERYDLLAATRVAPRAGLAVHLTPTLDLTASAGRYYQQPPLAWVVADPANDALRPMRTDHLVAGLAWTPRPDLRLSVEAYDKAYRDYPVHRDVPELSLANTGDFFNASGLLFPMTSDGTGRARGLELFVQQKFTGSTYGQVSYTFSETRHAGRDGVRRVGGFDTPHRATVIAGWKPGRWELSTRFSIASGRPFTPPLEPFSSAQNRYVFDLDRLNGDRAPAYQRFDVRADRRFRVAGANVTTFLEIQNVLNRENVALYLWNVKTRRLDVANQVTFLPILGLNVEF